MQRDPLTFRYPRTLEEAFGPDANSANPIEQPGHGLPHADRPVLITCAIAIVFLVLGTARGWF